MDFGSLWSPMRRTWPSHRSRLSKNAYNANAHALSLKRYLIILKTKYSLRFRTFFGDAETESEVKSKLNLPNQKSTARLFKQTHNYIDV